MKISHHVKRENSGLMHTTLEWAEEEQRQGHAVRMLEPTGDLLIEDFEGKPDVHLVHSQLSPKTYHDGIPKVMIMHGEPLSSVANGMSMRAIVDLAPNIDAFICMRREEWSIWNSIRRTYFVPKGIDLNRFKPMETPPAKLEGAPAVLYYENWREQRNPLMLCRAMEEVHKHIPEARLHLFNCKPNSKMWETFDSLIDHCRWYTFIAKPKPQEKDVVALLNRADIVVSGLYPLYARGIEAFGCGKAFIGAGYREPGYPYTCDLEVSSLAAAIIKCWAEYGKVDFRQWALDHHDVATTVKESLDVYQRFL